MIWLHQPIWLLLAVPMVASLWLWKMPSRPLAALRAVVYILALSAMAGLSIRMPSRAGNVVILVDRSKSMPADADVRALEITQAVHKEKGSQDELTVIAFGRTSTIMAGDFKDFKSVAVGDDASSYADALDKALSLIERDRPGRVLIIGDGRVTGREASTAAAKARARNIAIDYRLLERPGANDVAIERLDTPPTVAPGESYMLTAWVRSALPQSVIYELRRGNTIVARGQRDLAAGLNRMTFRDTAEQPGNQGYHLSLFAGDVDPVPENNTARMIVGVDGPKPILHLTAKGNSSLTDLLRAGKLEVKVATPDQMNWTLDELARYSSVLIENVPAQSFGAAGMDNVAAWVKHTGAGLMMTGGEQSYGPGGYYKSPLETIMPVSMELRKEHRKLSLAIAIVLDRSGSMAVPVAGGRTKMDLANLAAAEVVELLSGNDQVAVIPVDSAAHVEVPLITLGDNKANITRKIKSISSMGGGIFVYTGLRAAVAELSKSNRQTRHIILFTDANDSEEPGAYKQLLKDAADAGITCSVIGLGTPGDSDVGFIKDVAKRGGGRFFLTNKAQELPRLFAQDTFVVARSTFVTPEDKNKNERIDDDEWIPIRSRPALIGLSSERFKLNRPIGGYNLTYIRQGAMMGVHTSDEYDAPLAAWWQAGAGRALAYTGEADGKHTGPIAAAPDVGAFFTSMARWVAGENTTLPSGAMVTQELDNGVARVTLHLDPSRNSDPFGKLPVVRVLRGHNGAAPQVVEAPMRWSGPDELSYNLPLRGGETVINTVSVGAADVTLPPTTLPYSPEFQPGGGGGEVLERLAKATGGKQRDILGEIWDDLPKEDRLIEIGPWLLGAAMLLLVFEVFERRSGMLSARRRAELKRKAARIEAEEQADTPVTTKVVGRVFKRRTKKRILKAETEDQDESHAKPIAPESGEQAPQSELGSMNDALKAARERARGRTKR